MKKVIGLIISVLILLGAVWAKGYYNDRYVESGVYYTQIPLDEKNEKDEWIIDDDGNKVEKGKEYHLVAYDEKGNEREINFFKRGEASDYFSAGIYIQCSMSKTILLKSSVVDKNEVPKVALDKITENGTRIN
ncbi:YxeA family protein [Facklamia miroungae]|uniref:YxeA family protein n=1 Tax=Facklamia miroungae TaxID=120956 RepID=A0A1G7Q8D4_9LACT|nr:YxeA family protein [Facklamia miroungae]NKZ28859.1 YxeA family protein [Facklamia miroungae]SDF94847.1 conserved hypothetical protein TIGR01655 [Facklamia miroungae]